MTAQDYSLLGRFHSQLGAHSVTTVEMEKAYKKSQWRYLQAQTLDPLISPNIGALISSALTLLRIALSYPDGYSRLESSLQFNFPAESPSRTSDVEAYEDYLRVYGWLQEARQTWVKQAEKTRLEFEKLPHKLKKN